MTYRISEIDVPAENPFKNDILNREPSVEVLVRLLEKAGGPFVLAVDAPWGHGKSTFIKMMETVLVSKDFKCVNFNAWKFDFVVDPLVAMVSVLDQLSPSNVSHKEKFEETMKRLGKLASHLARRGVVLVVRGATHGNLDLQVEHDLMKDISDGDPAIDLVETLQEETSNLEIFRKELEDAMSQLTGSENSKPLIFFIDELDRCKPTFAIALLERVKHLFDVSNIMFVLSIDKSQLEAIVGAVYGQGINAPEYLRRFIDIEFGIPEPDSREHTEWLLARFELNPFFEQKGRAAGRDRGAFVETFSQIAEILKLTLRVRERCMTRLKVAMDQTQEFEDFNPVVVALLIILRTSNPGLFRRLHSGEAIPEEVMNSFKGLPGGTAFAEGDFGAMIEALLVDGDDDARRRRAKIETLKQWSETQETSNPIKIRADRMLKFIDQPNFHGLRKTTIRAMAQKVDIVANFRE
ncbi:MAG: P-loop NTPase fold protein [Candidatus Nanopelagicaceae bacterium]|nr:P-loop NTPase fold protein [Candidatus Nanopelagicaceae bacterium]